MYGVMSRGRNRLMLAAAALVAAFVAALAASNAQSQAATANKVIAFNVGAASDPFFVAMEVSADAEAKKLGYTVDWQGAPTEYSPATQIPIVDTQFAQKPAALIIAPTDPNALQAPVNQFIKAGIPVVNVDTHVTKLGSVLSFITGNNANGGQNAAKALAKAMHYTKGKTYQVAVGLTSATTTTNVARLAGFKQEIKQHYPGIKIVAVGYSQSQPTKADANVSNWLSSFPHLSGIFAIDGTNASGASAAIEAHNLVGKVALVGYDAYATNVALLKKGVFSALIAQNPTQEAKLAVDDVVKYLKHHSKGGIKHLVTLPNIVLTPKTSAAALTKYTYPAP